MRAFFPQTSRSLHADGLRRSAAAVAVATCMLGGWLAWFTLARVVLYEISSDARLEVDRAMHPLQSPVIGRVVTTNLSLGRDVNAGDLLVELDAEGEQRTVREERARRSSYSMQIAALREQAVAEERALREESAAARVHTEEAQASSRQARIPARFAADELERLDKLRSGGLIADREYERGRAEAEERNAIVDTLAVAGPRIEQEQRTRESDRQAQLRRLAAEITRIEGDARTSEATIQRLEYEIERRRIRATVSGKLGEVAVLRLGSVVQAGVQLAAIVPAGQLNVVAQFPAASAIGRLGPGQNARMRMHGFPWTEYGVVQATVIRVASEVRDGKVRVELAVTADRHSSIPLQHGLPGDIEVEVEQVSPAALLLRTAGHLLFEPRSTVSQITEMK